MQQGGEAAAEEVGVAGPARGQVVAVDHGEGWCVVGYQGGNAFTNVGAQALIDNWNGTAWKMVASPNSGSTNTLSAVATKPGTAIVWAVGGNGPPGSFNPLVLQNG